MSLQFIFGNSGSGKSHYLHQHIIQESMKHPEVQYLVLVPEQFTMQTQKDLCTAHPRGGIMNIDVLSFIRLSHRVFEETGIRTGRVLDDEGKNLILRKIAGNLESELKVLRGNLKKQGYISEVKSVISEFTQYGIGLDELEEFLEELEEESYLAYKLRDIQKVYEQFEAYLEDKYITKEELLDVLSQQVPESQLLKDSVVVLDGFTGFTPIQNKLLGELLKVCQKVIVTVEMDQREDPFTYRHPYQLFALSKQMVSSLVTIAGENRVIVDKPVQLYQKPIYRFRENPELEFLEEELFRYTGNHFQGVPKNISVHVTRSPKEEAEFVAAQIRTLVRKEGYRYRDIAVITSSMETYAMHLEKACEMFQIPIFMDHKKSILMNAFVEYVRSLLGMAEQGFTGDSVFRFLRTGMTGFTSEEVDQMENYVLALGLKGYTRWQQVWVRRTAENGVEELEKLNGLRVRFVEMVDALMQILKKRGKTVRDITLAVYEFLMQEHMQEQIQALEQKFTEEQELALAKEYSQVYRILMDLFDKFVELLGEEKISLKEYCELLDAGLEEAKVGVIPPSLDQVVIGDVERTRLNNLKALFFMGANDTLLPGNLGQGGLLSERDRTQFVERKIALAPGAKEKTYVQKFYLYLNLTKPSCCLKISFSKVSSAGKTLRPAYLVQDLQRSYPELRLQDEEGKPLHLQELNRKKATDKVISGMRDRRRGLEDEWKELYSWYFRETEKEAKDQLFQAAFGEKAEEQLDPEQAQKLYGDTDRFSVSRLEKFASCAYAHFLNYGLRLAEREQYEFAAMDLGNVAHRALELFSAKAEKVQLDWTELTEQQRSRMIEESVDESILNYGNTVLYSSARNEYMITRIKRLITRSVWALTHQMEQSDFQISGYEMSFGSGKIDRIDVCEEEDQVYVKVTDYKTGMKSFDITAFYHGLQIQLPIYLNAALEMERKKNPKKSVIPAGMFYYKIQDPLVEASRDEEVLEERMLKELRLDGLVNAEESVLEHLERDLNGISTCIPVGINKDGSLSRNSKVLTPDDFWLFLDYTKKKESDLKRQIADGTVDAKPYELGQRTGCDYCGYKDICGFDTRMDGYDYRHLENYSQEEVLEKIRKETEEK